MLGDVCGHGPDEAALGVQLRIAWRTLILAGVEQLALLRTLDRLTNQERHAGHVYATVASVEVDLDTGRGSREPSAPHPGGLVLQLVQPTAADDEAVKHPVRQAEDPQFLCGWRVDGEPVGVIGIALRLPDLVMRSFHTALSRLRIFRATRLRSLHGVGHT